MQGLPGVEVSCLDSVCGVNLLWPSEAFWILRTWFCVYVISASSHSWFGLFDLSWIHILLCPLVCQPLRLSGGLTFSCLFWLQLGLGMLFGSAGFVSGHVSQACNTSLVFGFPAWPFVVGCCMGSPTVELMVATFES